MLASDLQEIVSASRQAIDTASLSKEQARHAITQLESVLVRINSLSRHKHPNILALKSQTLCSLAYSYYLIGKPMIALGRLKQAELVEKKYLKMQPENPFGMARILLNEAVVRHQMNCREESIRLCEKAFSLLANGKIQEHSAGLFTKCITQVALQLSRIGLEEQSKQCFKKGYIILLRFPSQVQSKVFDINLTDQQKLDLKNSHSTKLSFEMRPKMKSHVAIRTEGILKRLDKYTIRQREIINRYVGFKLPKGKGSPNCSDGKLVSEREADLECIRNMYLGDSRKRRVATQLSNSNIYKERTVKTKAFKKVDPLVLESRQQLFQQSLFLGHSKNLKKQQIACKAQLYKKSVTPMQKSYQQSSPITLKRSTTELKNRLPQIEQLKKQQHNHRYELPSRIKTNNTEQRHFAFQQILEGQDAK